MRRLLLIRHATTDAVRRGAFPSGDEALDVTGQAQADGLAGRLGIHDAEALCSPALRALETATRAGFDPVAVEELSECDFGTWAGRSLAEVHAEDPESTRAWMTDPDARPHQGETLTELLHRVGGWLKQQSRLDGSAIVVTHGGVVKAAVVNALGAPPQAFWRIDVASLTVTELHAHDRRWTLTRVNVPLAAGRSAVEELAA